MFRACATYLAVAALVLALCLTGPVHAQVYTTTPPGPPYDYDVAITLRATSLTSMTLNIYNGSEQPQIITVYLYKSSGPAAYASKTSYVGSGGWTTFAFARSNFITGYSDPNDNGNLVPDYWDASTNTNYWFKVTGTDGSSNLGGPWQFRSQAYTAQSWPAGLAPKGQPGAEIDVASTTIRLRTVKTGDLTSTGPLVDSRAWLVPVSAYSMPSWMFTGTPVAASMGLAVVAVTKASQATTDNLHVRVVLGYTDALVKDPTDTTTFSGAALGIHMRLIADEDIPANGYSIYQVVGSSDTVFEEDPFYAQAVSWRITIPNNETTRKFFEQSVSTQAQVEIEFVNTCEVPAMVRTGDKYISWRVAGKLYCAPGGTRRQYQHGEDTLYSSIVLETELTERTDVLLSEGTDSADVWMLADKPSGENQVVAQLGQAMTDSNARLLNLPSGVYYLAIGDQSGGATSVQTLKSYDLLMQGTLVQENVYGSEPLLYNWRTVTPKEDVFEACPSCRTFGGQGESVTATVDDGYQVEVVYTTSTGTTTLQYDQDTRSFTQLVSGDTLHVKVQVRAWASGGSSGKALGGGMVLEAGEYAYTGWSQPLELFWSASTGEAVTGISGTTADPSPPVQAVVASILGLIGAAPGEDSVALDVWMVVILLMLATGTGAGIFLAFNKGGKAEIGVVGGGLASVMLWAGLGPTLFGLHETAAYLPILVVLLLSGWIVMGKLKS